MSATCARFVDATGMEVVVGNVWVRKYHGADEEDERDRNLKAMVADSNVMDPIDFSRPPPDDWVWPEIVFEVPAETGEGGKA